VYGNPVVFQKRLWRDVVNRLGWTDEELRDYFARWLMFSDVSFSCNKRLMDNTPRSAFPAEGAEGFSGPVDFPLIMPDSPVRDKTAVPRDGAAH